MNLANTIQRSLDGDRHAFGELFEAYKNLVYRTAYLILDDREEAEDALQEVFLRVHRALRRYDAEKGAFTTWLHRITVNVCLNLKRGRGGVRTAFLPAEEDQADLADPSENLEARLAEDQAIGQALASLNDGLRAAIVLRYYAGLSYAESAQALEIPIGTLKSRLNQAHQKLRTELEASDNPAASESEQAP